MTWIFPTCITETVVYSFQQMSASSERSLTYIYSKSEPLQDSSVKMKLWSGLTEGLGVSREAFPCTHTALNTPMLSCEYTALMISHFNLTKWLLNDKFHFWNACNNILCLFLHFLSPGVSLSVILCRHFFANT